MENFVIKSEFIFFKCDIDLEIYFALQIYIIKQ